MDNESLLKARTKYFTQMPTKWKQSNFCYDEPKMNLLWLVMPEVDGLIHTAWHGNVISTSIDEHLSKDLRAELNGPPLSFVRGFLNRPALLIADDWPHDYASTMMKRAREANSRLCADLAPNVALVDFKIKRKFG